jgi:D-ribose pyranase
MKKNGILHGEISKTIAELEHYDTILIGDAGMPCQDGSNGLIWRSAKGFHRFLMC